MDSTLIVRQAGQAVAYPAGQGQTVLDVLQLQGIPLAAPCGGNGTCGKCRIRVQGADGLAYRLACRTEAADGLVVELDTAAPMSITDEGQHLTFVPDADATGLGITIDVGTTTLVCRLFDLQTGTVLGVATQVNPQVVFGSDVISRIDASMGGQLAALNESLLTALQGLINMLCSDAGAAPAQITRIALAGNTVMEHLAANLPPDSIGVAPFTPLSLFGSALAIEGLPAPVFFAPAIAGYVGGDITAGLLAAQVNRASKPQLFIDLGTNGELALGDGRGITCCATAAGPVFEGAGIFFGMPALPGAIRAVALRDGSGGGGNGSGGGNLVLDVIGGGAPTGICGTGLIDAVALMLGCGVLDATGFLRDKDEVDAMWADHLGKKDGTTVFYLTQDRSIYVTQKDVRCLQLAKGAVCAGILTLLAERGLALSDVDALLVAGGFGAALNLTSAARIGLFPQALLAVARNVGNTAIEGISAALVSRAATQEMLEVARLCAYTELSTNPRFNTFFMNSMLFEEV